MPEPEKVDLAVEILLTVLVLAIAVFAVWFAMGPITEMLGLDGSTEPDVRSVVPGEP